MPTQAVTESPAQRSGTDDPQRVRLETVTHPLPAGRRFPTGGVLLPHALPVHLPLRSPVIGRLAPAPSRRVLGRGGPLQFPSLPSVRSAPHTPGGSSGLLVQVFTPSMAFALKLRARLLLFPPIAGTVTTRQISLHATDRTVAPPEGLLTSGFDTNRFPSAPPICYQASWQLPGPDLHRLATTSMSPDWSRHSVPTLRLLDTQLNP